MEEPPFVGRKEPLAELESALTDARDSRRAQALFVTGEAGIGKSRLAQEFARSATAHGVRVLRGGLADADMPFGLWAPVLRELVEAAGAEDPALLRRIEGLFSPAPRDARAPGEGSRGPFVSETARFHAFDAVGRALARLVEREAVLLVLDDLHEADESSLGLLLFLVRDLPSLRLVILGVYREADVRIVPGRERLLHDLAREGRRHALGGFSAPEVEAFAANAVGAEAAAALAPAVHAVTGGNPLFVREVLRSSDPDVLSRGGTEVATLPERLRDAIRRRLDRLSEGSRAALATAAVLGQEFRLDLLGAASDRERGEVLRLLDEAEAEGLAAPASGTVDRWEFGHPLVRETLHDDLPALARTAEHRRIAQAIERLGAARGRGLETLAHHLGKVATTSGERLDDALRYAVEAGEACMAQLGYEEAARHFERALELVDRSASPDERLRCHALVGLGRALARAGQVERSQATFRRASEVARTIGAARELAEAALETGGQAPWGPLGRVDGERVALLEEALATTGSADPGLRSRLLSALSWALLFAPERERTDALSREAVELARAAADRQALEHALFARRLAALSVPWAIPPDERLQLAAEALEQADALGDREGKVWALAWRFCDRLEADDSSGADRDLEAAVGLARELRQPTLLWLATMLRATRAILSGRFAEGRALAAEAMAHAEPAGTPSAVLFNVQQLVPIVWLDGGLAGEEPQARMAAELLPALPALRARLALVLAETGRLDEARAEFERLAADDFAVLPRDAAWHSAMISLAETCVHLGDRARAETLYGLLAPSELTNVMLGPGAACFGPADRSLGVLATILGRHAAAERHFERAATMAERLGARPFVALTRLNLAEMLAARDRPGDLARARSLLERVTVAAGEIGMSAVAAKAARLRGRIGESATGARDETVRLRREGEVWILARAELRFEIADSKGMRYLAELLRNPGRELHAVELAAAVDGAAPPAEEDLGRTGLSASRLSGAETLIDTRAEAEYRGRIAELRSEIDRAQGRAEDEVERANAELRVLENELAGVVGLGRRPRRFPGPAERARVSVTKRVRAAIAAIAERDRALGAVLGRSIRTGGRLRYLPDPAFPIGCD